MPKTRSFIFALAVAVLPSMGMHAQEQTIAVLDQNKVARESLAGKDVRTKLENIGAAIQRDLQPVATQLETEGKDIEARTQGMTPETLNADSVLKTQVEEYARKVNDFNRRRQIATQELTLTERKAWQDFYTALQPVLAATVTETGTKIIIDRSSLVYADPALDLTLQVISKLDALTPTIPVTLQKLSTQPEAQTGAQPNGN